MECKHEWYVKKFGKVISRGAPIVSNTVASDDPPAWVTLKITVTEWVFLRCAKCGAKRWAKVRTTRSLSVGSRVYDEEII